MSGSPNRAFDAAAKPRRREVNLELSTARQMLPLVRSIVKDIVESHQQIDRLQPVQENLDRHRTDLVWLERKRRYQVHEEIAAAERVMQQAVSELNKLGLSVLDAEEGRIGFPTRVNGRPALFTWQHGESDIGFWSYDEDDVRRPIPDDWSNGMGARRKSKT